jgi:trimethylamine monooxygenase
VRHVDFADDKNEFNIDVEDLITGSIECLSFDRVVVAIGHHHTPNMTNIDGVNEFPGRVLHSHEFRGADEFVGLHLLLIGGSFSADDIALQCYKFGVRSVTISSRREPVGLKWPGEIKEVPMLVRMKGRTAYFKDGSSVDNIDAIIFCTGYRHFYPFMAKRLRLHCDVSEIIPPSLYKSIFWIDQPHLAYLGSIKTIYSLPTFELQTALVRDVFLGHVTLPDKHQWQADVNEWKARERNVTIPFNIFALFDMELDYARNMLALLGTHAENQPLLKLDFDKVKIIFEKYSANKFTDVLHYRDIQYESAIGTENTKIVPVYKPWLENMDDSIESFLINYREKL